MVHSARYASTRVVRAVIFFCHFLRFASLPPLPRAHRGERFFNLATLKMDTLGHLRETRRSLSSSNIASTTNRLGRSRCASGLHFHSPFSCRLDDWIVARDVGTDAFRDFVVRADTRDEIRAIASACVRSPAAFRRASRRLIDFAIPALFLCYAMSTTPATKTTPLTAHPPPRDRPVITPPPRIVPPRRER